MPFPIGGPLERSFCISNRFRNIRPQQILTNEWINQHNQQRRRIAIPPSREFSTPPQWGVNTPPPNFLTTTPASRPDNPPNMSQGVLAWWHGLVSLRKQSCFRHLLVCTPLWTSLHPLSGWLIPPNFLTTPPASRPDNPPNMSQGGVGLVALAYKPEKAVLFPAFARMHTPIIAINIKNYSLSKC